MARALYGEQVKDRDRTNDLMFMLGFNETVDQLALVSNVCWYGLCIAVSGWSFLEKVH